MIIRPANNTTDIPHIARFVKLAGPSIYPYLFEYQKDLHSENVIEAMALHPKSTVFYKNCLMAEIDGVVAGGVVTAPAHIRKKADRYILPIGMSFLKKRYWLRYIYRLLQISRFSPLKDTMSIESIGVFPEFQRQGICTRLLDVVADRAVEAGFSAISLEVWANNSPAVAAYKKYGFTIVKQSSYVLKAYNKQGIYYMKKVLDPEE